jgi:hypothetical protein
LYIKAIKILNVINEKEHGYIVTTKDPQLYEKIMDIANSSNEGFDLNKCKSLLQAKGLKVFDDCLIYKALHILVRCNLLEKRYSTERNSMVYRLQMRGKFNITE